ncbi:MAG TPA: serine/threonine protein kinase [Myxococcales bacterium]|nr:serine/threonine protein kinase [Myxococcales bacterium]
MPGSSGHPFGKYVLLDRIAAGGMAEIFRAKYLAAAGVTKSVVIKRILPHYAGNRAFVSMFINEAKIACGLSHGNIAQVFDFGEIDGEYYLAMEHVYGQPLSRIARRAHELGVSVPTPFALFAIAEVCNGLHYAHTRCDDAGRPLGIVHRDVSPQNLLVGYEGEVKLVDFGIAKMRSAGGEGHTEHGALKGKFVYFSPEQARAKPLDGRSDIFATGIVLYELLTGRRPFEGKMMEVLGRIVKGELVPPSVLVPELPRELEETVMRALATRPEDRFQNALEMHDALHTYLHQTEPGFTSGAVGCFVRYLFRAELEAEGARPEVPAEFEEQLERWKRPTRPGSLRVPTWQEARPRRITTVETEVVPRRLLSGWRKVAAGAAALFVAGVALAFLFLPAGGRTFALTVTSRPPGATVLLDGEERGGETPARLEGLDATVAHRVELRLEGRRPFRTEVPPQSGEELALEAALDDLLVPGTAPLPSGVDLRDPVEDRLPPGPIAELPESRLQLVAREHAVSIPASPASRMRLDPAKTYRLSVEGVASLEGAGREQRLLSSVFYFGERVTGARTEGSFGQIRSDAPVEVSGLRALYGFILDDSPGDNSGALKIGVAERRSRSGEVLLVDPARNFIARTSRLARFSGLEPSVTYSVELTGTVDLGAGGGPAARLLYFVEAGDDPRLPRGGQGVLDAGVPLRVSGARSLWLLLPDDDPLDNSGELSVSISAQRTAGR